MSITELLEAHVQHDAVAKSTQFYCLCGWVSEEPRYGEGRAEHRAHVAEVLEQHMQEREARAWSDGFHKGRKTPDGSHISTWPKNPYRKESSDGR